MTTQRRFPPPWVAQESGDIHVKDAKGQILAYFYYEEERRRRANTQRLTFDDAERMAVDFAKVPGC